MCNGSRLTIGDDDPSAKFPPAVDSDLSDLSVGLSSKVSLVMSDFVAAEGEYHIAIRGSVRFAIPLRLVMDADPSVAAMLAIPQGKTKGSFDATEAELAIVEGDH